MLNTVPSAVPLLTLTPVAAVVAVAVYRQRRGATVEAPTARPTRRVALARSAFAAFAAE